MTAADIYLSAMHGWKPKSQKQKRSPEKRSDGNVIDFLAARERLSGRKPDPVRK